MTSEAPMPNSEESTIADGIRECKDFDSVLPLVGEFGKYQQLLLWLVCLPACIPCGFHAFNQLFMAQVPDHWCQLPPGAYDMNFTSEDLMKLFIPAKEQNGEMVYSRCKMFQVDLDIANVSLEELTSVKWLETDCHYGWVYDQSVVQSSVVIDYDLVCDRAIFPTVALSALNVGGIFGVYLFGVISDRYGRKISFFVCLTVELIGGMLTGLATDFYTWTAFRTIVGLTIPAIYQIPFIIGLELVGPSYRAFITVLTCIFYTFGMLLLAGVAYVLPDWTHLAYATTIPFFLYFGYMKFLPESPRWLLSQGKVEQVNVILKQMAATNGRELPDNFETLLKDIYGRQVHRKAESHKSKDPGILDLFRTPNMRLKTILITFNWFANDTVYVGLSYYGPAMGDDEYLAFALSALVELPSYILCWFVMDRWGRRWPLCLLMGLGGISCICTVLMPEGAETGTLLLYLISKFSISATFLILYHFAGELYPTEVRGVGIGFTAYLGGIGLVIIPFINYLGTEMLVLPLVIMGGLCVVGGAIGLRLPETLHKKLPQTLEDGEEFGKNFRLTDCLQCVPSKLDDLVSIELKPAGKPMEVITETSTPLLHDSDSTSLRLHHRLLRRQTSSLEMPFDRSGSVKFHHWV